MPGVTYWVRDDDGNILGTGIEFAWMPTYVDGSQTVRNMIDAIEASREAGNHDERNSLQHLFWVDSADFERILDMNLPVNTTPVFSTDFTEQDELALNLLGKKRVDEQYALYPLLYDVKPDDIADVKMLATVMDGKFTYRDGL